jgi:predicted dehydrogenase
MKISTIVIGHGYWGRNIARNINSNSNMQLEIIVEPNVDAHGAAAGQYPLTRVYTDLEQVNHSTLRNSMVFICTPPQVHAEVLEYLSKIGVTDICISKPYCLNAEDAKRYKDIVKMVDYTFLFSSAVQVLPKYLDRIGDIQHVSCVRANLGKIQECGVLYDLAVHDLSILSALGFSIDVREPLRGHTYISDHIADTFYSGIRNSNATRAIIHIHNSWLSHLKRKTMIFTGSKGIVVYDDNEPSDKITLYEKFIENPTDTDLMQYKYGDTIIPYIPANDPLGTMVEEFRQVCNEDSTHSTVELAIKIHGWIEEVGQ